MEQLSFALDVEDGWPPAGVEHVWCERVGTLYKLINAPFFIGGIAPGDTFAAEPDPVNGCIFEFTVVESSGHSLIWVFEQGGIKLEEFKRELLDIGCSIESLPTFKLHAIDVPAAVAAEIACEAADNLEKLGFAVAYPVWRHEHNGA